METKNKDYETWSFERLLSECKNRGLLTEDNKYVEPERTPEKEKWNQCLKRFMKQNNSSYDVMFALIDLIEQDSTLRPKVLEMILKC